jgi:acyl-coenzyme A thioesterase PaaI-like protein
MTEGGGVAETHPGDRREASSPYGEWADAVGDLMSYRYLASRPRALDRDRAENRLTIRGDLRTTGGLLAAPLAIAMLDTAGVNVDPINVLALTQVEVHVIDPALDVGAVAFHGHVTREARSQVFTETRMVDASDASRAVGFGTANWSIIVPTTGDFRYPEPGEGIPDDGTAPPLWEAYTGRRRADGRLEIPGLSPLVGTERLHHGPMLVVSEAAALDAAGAHFDGRPLAVEVLATSIVSPGRSGPFVAGASVLAGTTDAIGCRVELRDEGRDDRLVARTFLRIRAVGR